MTPPASTYRSCHTLPTIALLLLLLVSPFSRAIAQPVGPEDTAVQFETMQRSLSDPDIRSKLTPAQWETYSNNLAHALASGHDGLSQGALRMIIQYGDYLHFKRPAVFDIVRIYRNHENDNMRRMAVIALSQTNDPWAIDFLVRSSRFEKTPRVQHTILSVLSEHGYIALGPSRNAN